MSGKPFRLAVYMLIRDGSGRFLVLKRSLDSKRFPCQWDFPGGKVNPGERVDEALRREVLEETSLEVNVEHVVGVTELELKKVRVAVLIFEGHEKSGQIHLSEEHVEYAWVSPYELQSWNLPRHFHSFIEAYNVHQKTLKATDKNGIT